MRWGQGRDGMQTPITQGMTQSANYGMVLYSTPTLQKYWSNHQHLLVPSIPSALSSWRTNCAAFSEPNIFDKCLWIKFWLSGLVMHSEIYVSVLTQVQPHHSKISVTNVIPCHHSWFQIFFKSSSGTFGACESQCKVTSPTSGPSQCSHNREEQGWECSTSFQETQRKGAVSSCFSNTESCGTRPRSFSSQSFTT